MKKIKILFTGYYGFGNFGDDLFGLISIWGAKHLWKSNDNYLLSSRGPLSNIIEIKYAIKQKKFFKGYKLIMHYIAILKANFIILAGGSILNSKPHLISIRRFMFNLNNLNIVKIGAIGVSLGPFKSKEDYIYIRKTVSNFKFLALRDKASFKVAQSMGLPYNPILASDLAFILPQIKESVNNSTFNLKRKTVGISLCHYERYIGGDISNEERREESIYLLLINLLKFKDIYFRFFIINGNTITGDKQITYKIIKRLQLNNKKYEVINYSNDTMRMIEQIRSCNFMFSTRLHGSIIAAANNVPSLLVEYHQKCTDYLDDIGIDKSLRIGDMTKENSEIITVIDKFLYGNSINMYRKKEDIINRSLENFNNPEILKCFYE